MSRAPPDGSYSSVKLNYLLNLLRPFPLRCHGLAGSQHHLVPLFMPRGAPRCWLPPPECPLPAASAASLRLPLGFRPGPWCRPPSEPLSLPLPRLQFPSIYFQRTPGSVPSPDLSSFSHRHWVTPLIFPPTCLSCRHIPNGTARRRHPQLCVLLAHSHVQSRPKLTVAVQNVLEMISSQLSIPTATIFHLTESLCLYSCTGHAAARDVSPADWSAPVPCFKQTLA